MRWSVVCCSKMEAPYILEWACWYKLMGAEKIYLYDSGHDETKETLSKLIELGFVEYIHWPEYPAQYPAYEHALTNYRNTALAFFDADEYLLPMGDESVAEILDDMLNRSFVSGLAIGWEMFGDNFHETRPAELITEAYTKRQDDQHFECFTKCIVNPNLIIPRVHDPHWFNSISNFQIIREDGMPVKWGDHHHRKSWEFPKKRIRLNHYFTKSREDFMRKLARRGPDGNERQLNDFEISRRFNNRQDDTLILKHAKKLKALIECFK